MIRSDEGSFEGRGGAVLHWRTWTPPTPAGRVVIVHGLGEHAGRYELLAGALSGRGLAVFSYDLRGHGRSSGRRGHISAFEDVTGDLSAAVEESAVRIPGTLPTAVLGHSFGGLITLRYLLDRPDPLPDAAVFSAPWLETRMRVPAPILGLATRLERWWPGAPLRFTTDPATRTRDPVMMEAFRGDPLVHGRLSLRLFMEVRRAQTWVRTSSRSFPFPTLFLLPGADPLVDTAATYDYVQGLDGEVDVTELPGLRHEAFNEVEREEVIRDVGRWLVDALARTGARDEGSSSPISNEP